MDNDTTGLGAAAIAGAEGGVSAGVSGLEANANQQPIGTDATPNANGVVDANGVLSGTGDVTNGVTDQTSSAPDAQGSADDVSAIRAELEAIRAREAERVQKDQEAEQARQVAEFNRRVQAQTQQWVKEIDSLSEYDDQIPTRVKRVMADVVNNVEAMNRQEMNRLRQEADYAGRSFSALRQALDSVAPAQVPNVLELAKMIAKFDSPESQQDHIKFLDQRTNERTASLQKQVEALQTQLRNVTLQQQAQAIAANPANGGLGGGGSALAAATNDSGSFWDYVKSRSVSR